MTDTDVIGLSASSLWLDATNGLVASLYLVPVVKFIACSFGHLASACNTPAIYRHTVESFLTDSSAAHKTLTFSTHTDNIAC